MSTTTPQERRVSTIVGGFVFLGILVTCTLILYFGKVGDHFRQGYSINVAFSNASGLVHGSQVLYSGVLVGKVDKIHLLEKSGGVDVELDMFRGVNIRNDAHFMIKQSGLLGDQHIVVVPSGETAPFLKEGDHVHGNDPFDFSDVASQAGDAVKKLNVAIDKLSTEIIQPETMDNLKRSIKNFAELSKKLDQNAEQLNTILEKTRKGEGTVGRLLTDDRLFEELKKLIHNWRVHGLFHKDDEEEKEPTPERNRNAPR